MIAPSAFMVEPSSRSRFAILPALPWGIDLCHNSPHSLSYELLTVRRVLCVSDPSYKLPRQGETPDPHLASKIGLATSSGDEAWGCSAFQRMAAVMRVRPLG